MMAVLFVFGKVLTFLLLCVAFTGFNVLYREAENEKGRTVYYVGGLLTFATMAFVIMMLFIK